MKIRMLTGVLALFLTTGMSLALADDGMLIKDMESLRDSLPFKDAGRPQLTRRLADLYFQKAVEDDKNLLLTGKGSVAAVKALRVRAAKLYNESISGEGGLYPAATGELKVKIQFQLARLDRMEGRTKEALAAFKEVSLSPAAGADLKRETLMTVAEMQDENGDWKEAAVYYKQALPLCKSPESVSYVRYRISWALFRNGQLKEAQSEISLALWDAQGKPKDQVITDYIQFLSQTPGTDGREELSKIEPLQLKAGNPNLIENLGEAFFAVGNRPAGLTVFSHAKRLRPDPFLSARLAEEYYGFRKWDELRSELNSLNDLSGKLSTVSDKKREAIDQILRRLVVQIDGERKSNPGSYVQESCAAIDLHLKMFPQSDVVAKMRDGWIAAQTDDQVKMDRLVIWINDSATKSDRVSEQRFRQERAAVAQKTKNYIVMREEALALAKLSTDEAKKREWTYVAAKASQDAGNEAEALSAYVILAKVPNGVSADKWAIQSQNLAIAIHSKNKNYGEAAAQAATWTSNAALKADPALKAELASMSQTQNEAQFEKATSMGETPEALATYLGFCESGFQVEKSCANAKVLSVKLGKQDELIRSLKVMGDDEALASELERTGRFSEAATLLEKKLANSKDESAWIRVALMFQIGGDKNGQARVMRALSVNIKKAGKINPKVEEILESSFLSAGMNATETLSLPWSLSMKMRLAEGLEDRGEGNANTQKLLASSTEDLGPSWAKVTIARLNEMDAKQRKISFYGKNSAALYQARMRSLGAFAAETKKVLTNANTSMRVYFLGKLVAAYSDLDKEILATPVPGGLNDAQIQEVAAALESMAQPFRNEAGIYQNLQNEQYTAMGETAQSWKEAIAQGTDAFQAKYLNTEVEKVASTKIMTASEREAVLKGLTQNPSDKAALMKLRDDHSAKNEVGPAAYFTGRLTDIETNL